MRILYLVTKSEFGGAQTHVVQLCRYFAAAGHEVAVMSYPDGWLEGEAKKIGAEFFPNKYFSNSLNPLNVYKVWCEIHKVVANLKPDLVHCHSSAAGILGRLAVRNKIPTIFTAHGWSFNEGVPFWQKWAGIISEKIASWFCVKIICVCEFVKNLGLKYKIAPAEKFTVVYNGVEEAAPAALEIKEKIKFVFVGRLAAPKNPYVLVEAVNNLPADLRNKVEVEIIANGPQKQELVEMIKEHGLSERFKFLSGLSREQVLPVLKDANVFVLPTDWEGLPYTILEAMSLGLPVIASDVGGISEAVDEGCGILVKKGDTAGWTKALQKMATNPQMIFNFGHNARRKARDKFGLEKMLRKTEGVYNEVTSQI